MGTIVFSPGVKRPKREFEHSPPASAKVENEYSYNSAFPVCLRGTDKDSFAFFIVLCNVRNFYGHLATESFHLPEK
jgi:hypothetical protein